MKYQMKSCSRSGTLRNISTYAVHSERIEEVPGQAPDADERARDRRQDDAENRDAQRVRQADQVRLGVGLGRIEFPQALADPEAGGLLQEIETALDPAHAHVEQRVVHEVPAGGHHQQRRR